MFDDTTKPVRVITLDYDNETILITENGVAVTDEQLLEEYLATIVIRDDKLYRANPERAKAWASKSRARRMKTEGEHTGDDVRLQIKSQTDKRGVLHCWWCGKAIKGKYHIDHRIPLIKGGSDNASNLCITHPRCNLRKHDKLPHEIGRLL